MIFALLGVATILSLLGFVNKIAINKGMSSKTYLFSINIGIGLLSPLLFLFLPYQIAWSMIAILLLLGAGVAMSAKTFFLSKTLEEVSPLEVSAYTTLAIIATYFIDIILKINTFNVYALISLLVLLAGCFIISDGGKKLNKIKLPLLFLIIAHIAQGYFTYFALEYYMSPATFLFFVFFGTAIVMLPLAKKVGGVTLKSLSLGIIVQTFGLFNAILETVLAQAGGTYFILRIPAIMVATMLFTLIIKKDMGELPSKKQMLGALVVALGLIAYIFI